MKAHDVIRPIFAGKLLRLYTRTTTLPNGHRITLEMVRHPGAALIVPLLSRDRIIMLRQFRPVIGAYIYELPAGTLDPGERPSACARREIVEETGYRAGRIVRLGVIVPVPGYSTERITVFRAEALVPVERSPEADEVIRTKIMTKRQVASLVRRGKIVDAKTLSALALCGWLS